MVFRILNTTSGAYAAPPRPRGQPTGQSLAREDAGAPLVALNIQRPLVCPFLIYTTDRLMVLEN
jgi:hypothetical protein